MKNFKVNDNYTIVCRCENTRYGFRHLASLKDQYYNEVCKAKACYYNRTWESFEYESVISDLLRKSKILPEDQVREFLDCCRKDNLEQINKQFGFIAGFAKLGDILCDNTKDKNNFKAGILKAGFEDKGLIIPDDWNTLTEEEKEKRLNNVIKELSK